MISERTSDRYQNVVVFRSLQLGNLLCTIPALRAWRTAHPASRVTLIGLPASQWMPQRYPQYLDGFIPFPGCPGLPEAPPRIEEFPGFLRAVQEQKFDLALQMHGNGSIINPLVLLFGAGKTAGFYRKGDYCHDPRFFLPYPEEKHEIHRLLSLLEHLSIAPQGDELEFPLTEEERQSAFNLLSTAAHSRRLICVHPGSGVSRRRWAEENFIEVCKAILHDGWSVILTGTEAERPLCSRINRAAQNACLDLSGKTDLGTMAGVLERCAALVCNDTSVSHLASALKVRSLVIFTGSDPCQWAPLDCDRHIALVHPSPLEVCRQLSEHHGSKYAS